MVDKILQRENRQSPGETAPDSACATQRPRERIVLTARDLFHRHGIRGVGVDTIAEAAGTNKMTLYRHFGSKDDLIVECLQRAVQEHDQLWTDFAAACPNDPLGQLHAWIRQGANCIQTDGRGCEMANAAVELTDTDHPARRVIEDCKTAFRNRLAGLCAQAGLAQPDLVADTLSLLLEGARVSRQSVGAEGPSACFVRMAEAIIASFSKRDTVG